MRHEEWHSNHLIMIEANNPEIDVDRLMQKVQDEVARRQQNFIAEEAKFSSIGSIPTVRLNHIGSLLKQAEHKSQVRTEVPVRLDRFPLNISKRLLKFILKLYAFLFKEQRTVNLSLIQALQESSIINRQLIEQVTVLQLQSNVLSDRLKTTESRLATLEKERISNDSALNNGPF